MQSQGHKVEDSRHILDHILNTFLLNAEEVACPAEDNVVGRNFGNSGVDVFTFGLPILEGHPAFADVPASSVVSIVVDHGLAFSAAGQTPDISASHYHLVVVELVFVAIKLATDSETRTNVAVHIVVVVVIVTSKIVLHTPTTVDEEVVVGVIKTTPIIIIDILLRAIVVDEKIVVDFPPLHDHARFTCSHSGQKGLTIPRVERPVVTGFPAGGEDEVMADLVTAAKTVVSVDTSSRAVEEDITGYDGFGSLGLHEE